jgi:hypothetical protein
MAKIEWKQGFNNSVLQGKGFFISYNPCPGGGISFFRGDNGGDETALVKDGSFYILNGDFRKQYEKLLPKGFKACKDFFLKNLDKVSSWSDSF